MKILSEKKLCEMEGKALQNYILSLEFYARSRGLYEKDRTGSLTDSERATFARIMRLFRFSRINLE